MKILFVSLFLPQEKAYHAGGRYVFELLRRLSQNHEIHLATRLEEDELHGLAELSRYCAMIHPYTYPSVVKRDLPGVLRLVANYLGFSRYARRLVESGQYDLVQVEWVETALLMRRGATPMVLDAHDVITKPAERAWRQSSGVRRVLHYCKYLMVRTVEQRIMSRFDRIITLSDFDRDYLRSIDRRLPAVAIPIPAGLDLTPARYPRVPKSLLFLASYKYRGVNVQGALYFYREVLPLVRAEIPEAHFVIAGYGPPQELTELERNDPYVRVPGFVEDTDEEYKSAAVFVAPILTGGGIIVKVLDALAAGTPVVTTSFGNEGIGAKPGRDLLVADDPRAFADAVLSLLRDEDLAQQIGRNGKEYVTQKFGVDAVIGRIEGVYREVARQRPGRH